MPFGDIMLGQLSPTSHDYAAPTHHVWSPAGALHVLMCIYLSINKSIPQDKTTTTISIVIISPPILLNLKLGTSLVFGGTRTLLQRIEVETVIGAGANPHLPQSHCQACCSTPASKFFHENPYWSCFRMLEEPMFSTASWWEVDHPLGLFSGICCDLPMCCAQGKCTETHVGIFL